MSYTDGGYFGGGGGSTLGALSLGGTVVNYAALPDATTNANKIYYCTNDQGVWPVNFKAKGYYVSNGIAWSAIETDTIAQTQFTDHINTYNHAILLNSTDIMLLSANQSITGNKTFAPQSIYLDTGWVGGNYVGPSIILSNTGKVFTFPNQYGDWSGVNHFTFKPGATTAPAELGTIGDDTNIDLKLFCKGTGKIQIAADAELASSNKQYMGTASNATKILYGSPKATPLEAAHIEFAGKDESTGYGNLVLIGNISNASSLRTVSIKSYNGSSYTEQAYFNKTGELIADNTGGEGVQTVHLGSANATYVLGSNQSHFVKVMILKKGLFKYMGIYCTNYSATQTVKMAVYSNAANPVKIAEASVSVTGVGFFGAALDVVQVLGGGSTNVYWLAMLDTGGSNTYLSGTGTTGTEFTFQGTAGASFTTPETTKGTSNRHMYIALY